MQLVKRLLKKVPNGKTGKVSRPEDETSVISRTIEECKIAHQSNEYFQRAESFMDAQWEAIWPMIKAADFSIALEIAPGYGRNTARLIEHTREIHLVDVNQSCIEKCKERFSDYQGKCRLYYHVNDGHSLPQLPAEYITFVYSWDSMVHFDKLVVRDYIKEFARVLVPGGTGFIHHSNYGTISQSSDWQSHPHLRSNMTRDLFKEYCTDNGLEILSQKLIDWGEKDLDCLSIFMKP
jgi:ubiquinone/menaquinone biosynthesis C-methylase UbiE